MSIVLVVSIWALLDGRIFNSWRRDLVEQVLTEQIGREVDIAGDVSITLGRQIKFTLSDVTLPSETIDGTSFIKLEKMSLNSNAIDLLNRKLDFRGLDVSGLTVSFLTTEAGVGSWSVEKPSNTRAAAAQRAQSGKTDPVETYFQTRNLLNFVVLRSDSFSSINVVVDNQESGFIFEFNLEHMTFERPDNKKLVVSSIGTVNDASFGFDGEFAPQGPFSSRATFGDMVLTFDGTSEFAEQGNNYSGDLEFQSGEISQILDILKLEGELSGSGSISAIIKRENEIVELSEMTSTWDFADGRQFTAVGTVRDLERAEGVDLKLGLLFFPEGKEPARAQEISELRLTEITAEIVGDRKALTIEDADIKTNAFNQDLDELGPISIGNIHRTDDGNLRLDEISVQAGPVDAPYVKATGSVGDALEIKDFDFEGQISAPSTFILARLGEDVAEQFGAVEGSFTIDDENGFAKLDNLEMHAVNTDLWSLDLTARTGEDGKPKSGELDFALEIADSSAFLGALGLREIGVSPLGVSLASEAVEHGVSAKLGFTAGKSKLDTSVLFQEIEGDRKLEGSVHSKELFLSDLQELAAGLIELGKFTDRKSVSMPTQANGDPEEIEVQPLVLPKPEPDTDEEPSGDAVLPDEINLDEVLAEEGVQPLVLATKEPKMTDWLDPKKELLQTDVEIGVDIEKLSGIQGVSSVSSDLTISGGKAQFGPMEVAYGGGYVKAEAKMDIEKSPELVTVAGATSGWDFGKILDAIGVNFNSYGTLGANFNLTGRHQSVAGFIDSMYGPVSVTLAEGKIATSLIELAGLGVFPWLFSEERRQRYTNIACLSAPLQINAGKVTFDPVVVETNRVQLVAKGSANWRQNTINVRGEPRPVGKPLSRSAWPFDVTGKLNAPNFKLQAGGSRSRRADGASKMPADRRPCVADIMQLEQ